MHTKLLNESKYNQRKALWQPGWHFGIDKTIEMVRRSYFWPKLNNDVRKFIESCTIFQQEKGMTKNQGLYQPLPIPSRP